MTEAEFSRLKQQIKEKEEDSIRAQGAIDQLKETWKKQYGFDTVEAAQAKLAELNEEINKNTEKKNQLQEKLLATIPEEWR